MLDPNLIRENTEAVRSSVRNREMDISVVDDFLEVDESWRKATAEIENIRAKKNKLGKDDADEARKLKEEEKALNDTVKELERKRWEALEKVPNLVASDVPVGKDESANKPIRKWGTPTEFGFKPRDHVELGELLGIIDTEKSARISGARFNYLMRDAVALQFALIQFAMRSLTDRKIVGKLAKSVDNPSDTPFIPVLPPVIAKAEIMKKMDRFDPIDDRYYLEKDNSLLIGSAEHTLGPLHMDEILDEKDLPIRYLGYSTAFRREAGAYGKDAAGIFRRHQFDKIEMETFSTPQGGEAEQRLMVAIQEYFMQQLEIPYQVVAISTGDMGKPDYRQLDIESWIPSQGKYRETHTSDYMTDYQARRLNVKYKKVSGGKEIVHMNDATAIAIGRTLITILENYQTESGTVKVPKILRDYVGKKEIKAAPGS